MSKAFFTIIDTVTYCDEGHHVEQRNALVRVENDQDIKTHESKLMMKAAQGMTGYHGVLNFNSLS